MSEPPRARSLVMRVWLPDRPGALGQVASRIGAVRGDVTAIDILERGGGRVVDELAISLPESVAVELLAAEVGAVDGVAIEQIRQIDGLPLDAATQTLTVAAAVVEAPPGECIATLCRGLRLLADADWTVAVRAGAIVHRDGDPPDDRWLTAFLDGSEHLDADASGAAPTDVLWVHLPRLGVRVAAGRRERPVHDRERARAGLLARIVDGSLVRGERA